MPGWCLLGLMASMAVDVYEMVVLIAGSAVQGQRLSAQGLAGGGEPQLPFLWGLRFVVGVQQVVPAEWAASALGLQEAQGGLIQRGLRLRRRCDQ